MTITTKKYLQLALIVLAVVCALTVCVGFNAPTANATNATPVAKVGTTEYTSIDTAVENWTHGTTLTLLSDVTLSGVVKLKSTEAHTLNLATYTLTAASGQHAIEVTCNGRSSASYALTVNADATNPGGINAPGKSCIYYRKIGTTKDRPIILINNGVFNGSYSVNFTSNGNTNCPQLWINNGTFNGNVNLTKCLLQVKGGFFNCSLNCSGDTNAYRLISGGTFKNWQFMTADANTKFTVGSSKTVYDKGAYVNEEGYLVVGGAPLTVPGTMGASTNGSNSNSTWSSYLKYSSAKDTLYWEDAESAIEFLSSKTATNKPATEITVYENQLDLTDSTFKGAILVPEGNNISITYAEGQTPTWTVKTNDDTKMVVPTETVENGKTVVSYAVKTKQTVSFDSVGGSTVPSGTAPNGGVILDEIPTPTMEGHTFAGWYTDPTYAEGTEWDVKSDAVTGDLTLYARWTLNQYTVTYDCGSFGTQTAVAYHGEVLTETNPEFAGYVFMGWYADAQLQNAYDFTTPITGDVTMYGKFVSVDEVVDRINNLEDAQTQLQVAIDSKASGQELATAVSTLSTAITDAQAMAEATAQSLDAQLKAELENKIIHAEKVCLNAIDKVASDLEKAKVDLQTAIDAKASSQDLQTAVENLSVAIETAKVVAIATAQSLDEALKVELEGKITSAQTALQQSINKVANDLEVAKTQLQTAIDGKASNEDLQTAVTNLSTAIENAKAVAIATAQSLDETLKAELEGKITSAQTELQQAINKVANDLEVAKTQLQTALYSKADQATVDAAFQQVNATLAQLQAISNAYVGADAALKSEMQNLISSTRDEILAIVYAGDKKNEEQLQLVQEQLQQQIVLSVILGAVALLGNVVLAIVLIIKKGKSSTSKPSTPNATTSSKKKATLKINIG